MTDHKFSVEEPGREISFSLDRAEANKALEWMYSARDAIKADKGITNQPPMILCELIGAFSAIADGRGYGGS